MVQKYNYTSVMEKLEASSTLKLRMDFSVKMEKILLKDPCGGFDHY